MWLQSNAFYADFANLFRETTSIKVDDISSEIFRGITAAVKSTNELLMNDLSPSFHYDRKSLKRRRYPEPKSGGRSEILSVDIPAVIELDTADEQTKNSNDPEEALLSLSNMVAVLCEQKLYLPLLRAFDIFLPSCLLLPFVRFLQVSLSCSEKYNLLFARILSGVLKFPFASF